MMEFNEKIKALRKQKGLTQEELAQALYVSRTAISKWESGRGYPNIDSLKALAQFFGVAVDELLSGDEVLTMAEADVRQKASRFHDLTFGLLDCSMALFLLLPIFGQSVDGAVQTVALAGIASYLKIVYAVIILLIVAFGIATLALQGCQSAAWVRSKRGASLLFNAMGALVFIISRQPYAAAFVFVFLAIRVLVLLKRP